MNTDIKSKMSRLSAALLITASSLAAVIGQASDTTRGSGYFEKKIATQLKPFYQSICQAKDKPAQLTEEDFAEIRAVLDLLSDKHNDSRTPLDEALALTPVIRAVHSGWEVKSLRPLARLSDDRQFFCDNLKEALRF